MTEIEVDIQHWLTKKLQPEEVGDLVRQAMIKALKGKKSKVLNIGFSFFLSSGQQNLLFQFVFENLWTQPEKWPWAHLMEAILNAPAHIRNQVLPWMLLGSKECLMVSDFAKTRASINPSELGSLASDFLKHMPAWKAERFRKRSEQREKTKQEMMDLIVTFRIQQLYDPERKLLRRLELMYPRDSEVKLLVGEHKKRYAFEILERRLRSHRPSLENPSLAFNPEDETWVKSIAQAHLELGRKSQNLKDDLIVSALMLDLPEVAYDLISQLGPPGEQNWLTLEVLLAVGRHAELLSALDAIELAKASEPETFFATAYFRAQAYYGLGQKEKAIEIMEGLLTSRPDYRSGHTLLNLWRSP